VADLMPEIAAGLAADAAYTELLGDMSQRFVLVVLGTTIHEFACNNALLPHETRGWSDQVRP
jgi:hypothetical protein